MDAYTAVVTKRDTRAFAERPVDEESLRRVLQAGRMAGSSKNSQPCRFVVARERATKERLAACGRFASWIPDAPVTVAVVLLPGGSAFDAGRAAQNMLVTANAEGLGSCPVSLHDADDARAVLGVPDDHQIATLLAIGHPPPGEGGARRRRGPRLPFDEYVRWEHWEARRPR